MYHKMMFNYNLRWPPVEKRTNFLQAFLAVLLPPGFPPGSEKINKENLIFKILSLNRPLVAARIDCEAFNKASENEF